MSALMRKAPAVNEAPFGLLAGLAVWQRAAQGERTISDPSQPAVGE
jgi:hypothetical protein